MVLPESFTSPTSLASSSALTVMLAGFQPSDHIRDLGRVLADFLHVSQQEEQTYHHEHVHADEHGEERAVHGNAHHQLGDVLFGGAGSESDQGRVGGDADGTDGSSFSFLQKITPTGTTAIRGV